VNKIWKKRKGGNSGPTNIKGDNLREIVICAKRGYPLLFYSQF